MKSSPFLKVTALALIFLLNVSPVFATSQVILAQDGSQDGGMNASLDNSQPADTGSQNYNGGYGAPQDYSQPVDTSNQNTNGSSNYYNQFTQPILNSGDAFSAPSLDTQTSGSFTPIDFSSPTPAPALPAPAPDQPTDTFTQYEAAQSAAQTQPQLDSYTQYEAGMSAAQSYTTIAPQNITEAPLPDTPVYTPPYSSVDGYTNTQYSGGYGAPQDYGTNNSSGNTQSTTDNSGVYNQNTGTYNYGNGIAPSNTNNNNSSGNVVENNPNTSVSAQQTASNNPEYYKTAAWADSVTPHIYEDDKGNAIQVPAGGSVPPGNWTQVPNDRIGSVYSPLAGGYVPVVLPGPRGSVTNSGMTDAAGNKFVPAPTTAPSSGSGSGSESLGNVQGTNTVTADPLAVAVNKVAPAVAPVVNTVQAGLGELFGNIRTADNADLNGYNGTAASIPLVNNNLPLDTAGDASVNRGTTPTAAPSQTQTVTTVQTPSANPQAYQNYLFGGNLGGCSEGGTAAACVITGPYMPILEGQYAQIVQAAGPKANLPSFDSLSADQLAGLKDRIESVNGNLNALGGIPVTKVAAPSPPTSSGSESSNYVQATNSITTVPSGSESSPYTAAVTAVATGAQTIVNTTKIVVNCAVVSCQQQNPYPESGISQNNLTPVQNPYPESGQPQQTIQPKQTTQKESLWITLGNSLMQGLY